MQSKEKDNLIFIRLFPGEDIFQSLTKVCQKYRVETAVILSGLGQLKNFKLGFLKEKDNYCPQEFQETYELLALEGNISNQKEAYKFHIHAVLGDEEKSVVGGHLIAGTVETTNEIVLLETDLKIKRKLEPDSGLEGMFLE